MVRRLVHPTHLDRGGDLHRRADRRCRCAVLPVRGQTHLLRRRTRRPVQPGPRTCGAVRGSTAGEGRVRRHSRDARRTNAGCLPPPHRQRALGILVAVAAACRGVPVLDDPGTRFIAARRHRLRGAHPEPLRPHRRGVDTVSGHDKIRRFIGALPVAPRRSNGHMVTHRRRAGVRGVHHGPFRSRPAHRQARRLVPRRHLLPGRHGQYGARRHHREAHRRQGAHQPRRTGLHCGLDRFAHRLPNRVQRLAGVHTGVHFRRRGQFPRHRSGSHCILLRKRSILFLRHLRRAWHLSAER